MQQHYSRLQEALDSELQEAKGLYGAPLDQIIEGRLRLPKPFQVTQTDVCTLSVTSQGDLILYILLASTTAN